MVGGGGGGGMTECRTLSKWIGGGGGGGNGIAGLWWTRSS